MIFSQRIYFIILFHVLLILVTAGTGLWLVVSHTGYIIGGILLLCSLFQIGALTRQLNTFNRKIRLFFDAVQDKDNMLYFPEANVGKEQAQLNRSLNRLNDLLARTKGESHKQEHFYQSLLEEVPSGVLAWDDSGRIIIANSAAFSLLKCNRLYTETQLAQLLNVTGIRKSLSISEKKMILDGETITILSIKDIGDELSDKENESWSKLTHVLTHEIMNTIAPILSLTNLVRTSGYQRKIGPRTTDYTGSERTVDGVYGVIPASVLSPPSGKRRFALTEMLRNLEELLQSDFRERGIRFMLQCVPDPIETDGDPNQLSQVFLNLLKNAMQALEGQADGRIILRVRRADRLQVEIEDNGPGIPEEIREQIFIPFFTTKTEGSGIGLSLCKQIIRQHDGHLSIRESRPGQTIFSLDLP